jgi:glycosyltransferase involved in cell wall biosynthesis
MEAIKVTVVGPTRRWVGGQSVQADLLLRNWQNDPAARVSFVPIDPDLPDGMRWIENIPVLRTLMRSPFYFVALWRGTKEADIVHIFSASYWAFLLAPLPAWLIARLRRKKALIHYHSGEAGDHLRRSSVAHWVLQRVDRVVVPSMYLVDVFRDFHLRADMVPNIVDSAQFSFRVRRPVRPRLICPRGFHAYYGVDAVVHAFAMVKGAYPEASLCLVGKGPAEGEIRELVKQLGLKVLFAGPVTHKDISHYYDQNDIFINGSWLDNMPVSILEAFASGTPVVTTAPDGIRYLVEHERTGLLCEPGDWRRLAENVIRLVRDPELALRLAQNALAESQRYHWKAVRSQWLEVYRSLQRGQESPEMGSPAPGPQLLSASPK